METQAQYEQRVASRQSYFERIAQLEKLHAAVERRCVDMNFTPIEDKEVLADILSARQRGKVRQFFTELEDAYNTWAANEDNEGRTFAGFLNAEDTDPFYGHKTDSLYSSFTQYIAKNELKESWRVMKRGEHLAIAHL